MLSQSTLSPTPSADQGITCDVDLSNFMVEVIEASKKHLVIVDFWATWCGPCKQLGPVLEKLVAGYRGAVRLAKIDIDKNQPIAQQMGVQSVPAVFAFFQGRPVDGFMGALPEGQVKGWIDQLLKATGAGAAAGVPDLQSALKQAEEFLAAGDMPAAHSVFSEVLEVEPQNPAANAGIIRCVMAAGQMEEAKALLAELPTEVTKDKSFDAIRTAFELAEQSGAAASEHAALVAKVAADPTDHQARFDLALACYALGKREEAVDNLLEIVRRNRGWNEDAARKQLVKFFEAFGMMDPLTIAARKRLSSILFS